MGKGQTHWDSRTAFILAAIGSAIGLGNIWRFPYVCYKYGGGAFLIPYLFALFTTGIPLMILEFSLGHKMNAAAPTAFARVKKKYEWIGWFALGVSFIITCYYAVIMGWAANFLKFSLTLEWGQSYAETKEFFFGNFLGLTESIAHFGSIKGWIVLALVFCWIWILASVWEGAKTVSKVVYVTVLLPWAILIVFMIRGLTLPGAFEGLRYYLTPDFSALLNLEVWAAAYTQAFFSLTLGFGVMIAYASFLPRKSDLVNNAFIICLADAATAFVSGIVVFSTLGFYALQEGKAVADVVASGPGLAFVTYPAIINALPASRLFGVLFFLMLLTLGIDSAFSLTEAVSAGIMDKWKLSRKKVNFSIASIAFFIGLVFCMGSGLYWLDIVDRFMNNFGLIIVALLECIVLGYFYNLEELRQYANKNSEIRVGKWWNVLIKIVTPLALLVLLSNEIIDRIKGAYENYPRWAEFVGGWFVLLLIAVTALLLTRKKEARD